MQMDLLALLTQTTECMSIKARVSVATSVLHVCMCIICAVILMMLSGPVCGVMCCQRCEMPYRQGRAVKCPMCNGLVKMKVAWTFPRLSQVLTGAAPHAENNGHPDARPAVHRPIQVGTLSLLHNCLGSHDHHGIIHSTFCGAPRSPNTDIQSLHQSLPREHIEDLTREHQV